MDNQELMQMIAALKEEVANLNLRVDLQAELIELLSQNAGQKAPRAIAKRAPKIITNLIDNQHYFMPMEWCVDNMDFIESIVNDIKMVDNQNNYEYHANFILKCLSENMGLPVFHRKNGLMCIHRFGRKKFNVLVDFDKKVDEAILVSVDKNDLYNVEKESKQKMVDNAAREEKLSQIIWKSDEIKEAVLSRKYVEEDNE